MVICKACIEAIKSRGELVVIDTEFENEDAFEMDLCCEWCGESTTDLCSARFPTTESILDLV